MNLLYTSVFENFGGKQAIQKRRIQSVEEMDTAKITHKRKLYCADVLKLMQAIIRLVINYKNCNIVYQILRHITMNMKKKHLLKEKYVFINTIVDGYKIIVL